MIQYSEVELCAILKATADDAHLAPGYALDEWGLASQWSEYGNRDRKCMSYIRKVLTVPDLHAT